MKFSILIFLFLFFLKGYSQCDSSLNRENILTDEGVLVYPKFVNDTSSSFEEFINKMFAKELKNIPALCLYVDINPNGIPIKVGFSNQYSRNSNKEVKRLSVKICNYIKLRCRWLPNTGIISYKESKLNKVVPVNATYYIKWDWSDW